MLLMKQTARIISTYAADVSGVCSALYELGGMTVMHDASGCNSTYNTHDEPRWYDMDSMVYISALSEMEAVMGDDRKLVDDIVSVAKELHPGEEVLFVGTEPYGGPGDFELRGGHIRFVDPERKTCTVKGSFFDMKDVPLRYVLGRYNAEITETHYGRPHVEVLFGEYPALAQQYLHEAEERWEQYETDAAAAPTQTM